MLIDVDRLWPTSRAAYSVSMPSGMMTIKDVPTSTPVPIAVISRNFPGERVKAKGSAPARNELD